MKSLMLCGHSHLAALAEGFRDIQNPKVDIKFVPLSGAKYRRTNFSILEPQGVRFVTDEYRTDFEERTGETHFDKTHLWGFCLGGYPLRLDSGPQWKRCRPSPLWEAGKRPVTLAQIDAVNASDQKATKYFVRNLKDAGVQFFFVALPLSVRNFYEDDTDSDLCARTFVKMRGRDQFQKWLAQEGVDFIDLPSETVTHDGFMHPEYMRLIKPDGTKDYNHGNAKYGKLMIAKIEKHVFEI